MATAYRSATVSSRPSKRLKRSRVPEAVRIARQILPAAQAEHDFKAVDVANHSEADQRHMVRSGEKRTIRRRTHIERLGHRIGLEDREIAACQWYADAHSARYDTLGLTASYGDSSRSSKTNFDHLPATAEQDMAGDQFNEAREAISPPLRLMFDRVILHGFDVGTDTVFMFRLAVRQVMHRIEGWVEL